jgi:hypothetical protein
MVKSDLANNKCQKAFFPTMYENSLKNQKVALHSAIGVPKLDLGSDFSQMGKG